MGDSVKTLYTTPTDQLGFESLSWSPDSQRVASASLSGGAQFWDATTGDHCVVVPLLDDPGEWVYALNWSPKSRDVAVATNRRVLLVDGQTGHVLRSYSPHVSILSPTGGGSGYRATAWSPDGEMLASARSFVGYGEVQVWNPQTGALHFTLSAGNAQNIGALAWSSDGRFLAGTTWNTQPTDHERLSGSKFVVWDIATHQIVFQHSPSPGSNAPVAWQPQSSHLAFGSLTPSEGHLFAALEIWNVTTGTLVKQYVGGGTGGLAWEPSGTSLAYTGPMRTVIIIDVDTDKQVHVYKEHHLPVRVIAWSPNGQYIVSGEGNAMGQAVARVWTAAHKG